MLAETLYLIISNDKIDNFNILNSINESCWDVLILWFF